MTHDARQVRASAAHDSPPTSWVTSVTAALATTLAPASTAMVLAAGLLAPVPVTAQAPSTDLWVIPLDEGPHRVELGRPVRATDREGYDNQPHFLPGGREFLFTRIDEAGQADIWRYDLTTDRAKAVTETAPESEYSATLMPDGERFSSIRVEADSTQRLWWFDLAGGQAGAPLLERIQPVGYHAWADGNTLVLFVLGDPATLQVADLTTGQARVVAADVGRTLLPIPGTSAVSFLQYRAGGEAGPEGWITELEPSTGAVRPLIRGFSANEYYTWTPNGTLLTASGSRLYRFRPGDEGWIEVADLAEFGIEGISRLAVSPDGARLALVAEH